MLGKYFTLVFLLSTCFSFSNAKTTLSVMDLSASGITQDDAKTLTYRLIAELDKLQGRGWFTLVATEKRNKILKEWAFQQSGICDEASCIAEFGKALGVRQMIGGNVGKIGDTYSITLILVDVSTVKVENTAIKDYKGKIDGLLAIFPALAAEITSKEINETSITPEVTMPTPYLPPSVSSQGMTLLGKNSEGFEQYRNNKDGSVLILIPEGKFRMGSESLKKEADTVGYGDRIMIKNNNNSKLMHDVYLVQYLIGKNEITNSQYKKFCDEKQYPYPHDPNFKGMANYLNNYPDYPVVNVTWSDVNAYCEWADLRLPTEAEWEKAAKSLQNIRYSWGDEGHIEKGKCDRCNYKSYKSIGFISFANDSERDGYKYTAPVGSFPRGKSPYGVLDMIGNVSEWCQDWFSVSYYANSPQKNPTGPDDGTKKVVRGGDWNSACFQVSDRQSCKPSDRENTIGFRTAK